MEQPDFEKMSPEEIAEYQRQNCIFCKIIKGEVPSRKVFEDDKVLCILDINPAIQGHMLMMTKEHYPFLPAIPPEVSVHMFKITKGLAKAAKQALVSDRVTIFIANGGIAGQQSPHFLYHIMAREKGDGLDNFNVPAKDADVQELDKEQAVLKGKIGLMMREADARINPRKPEPAASPIRIDSSELAKMILENPEMRDLITRDPVAFKQELRKNAQLAKVFEGVDIDKLAFALGQVK